MRIRQEKASQSPYPPYFLLEKEKPNMSAKSFSNFVAANAVLMTSEIKEDG